jgi:hypothetical protein
VRPRVGDVFLIPVANDEHAYAQIVDKWERTFLVVVFSATDRNAPSIEVALTRDLILAGTVFDAKLANGDWPIVGSRPPRAITEPWFVEGHNSLRGGLILTNLDFSVRRPVTSAEVSGHHPRHMSGPMLLQLAATAACGRIAWRSDFDHFRDLAAELAGRGSDR